jgi:hypothetical protein
MPKNKKSEDVKSSDKSSKKSSKDNYKSLEAQIQTEYNLAWNHQKSKKDEAELRLKLYNNQRRAKKDVGDTTLFTVFQTILASLYVDRLMVDFGGREEGDEETAENLNMMAEYDYTAMEKDKLDYDWMWDTCFFGRGLVVFEEYIRDPDNGVYLPVPHVLDPIPFLRDPRATSVNGDRTGRGAARFLGSEIKMSKQDMEDNDNIFDVNFKDIKFGSGTQSLLQDAIEARNLAQGLENNSNFEEEENLDDNGEYDITVWYTHYKVEGEIKKVKVWLANERSKVIGFQELEHDYFPIIDRSLFPTSHDWDGTSIPDLTEDKQRARAVAVNLGLNAMKADLYPMYIYDSNKIVNRKDLAFNYNKFIPMDSKGENLNSAIMPMNKARPNLGLMDFILNAIDLSAQKATATPDIQQGIQSAKDRPLGETNLLASNVNTRYSLSAKVFGWSDKEFWRQWYRLYKDNFTDDIDEKVLRLVGAFGAKWRPLKKKDIVLKLDPDIKIESQVVSRAQQLEDRQSLTGFFSLAFQEPTANRRYGMKKLAKLHGLQKDEIDRLFPMTIDERIAEDENELLNENKFAPISAEDDHNSHLETHSKAKDTKAKEAHIDTHKEALTIKKTNPEFFPEDPEEAAFQPPGTSNVLPTPLIVPSQTTREARQ